MLTVLAAVVLGVATLPLFGGTVQAATLDLQNSVAVSQFVIPGGPQTKITAPIASGTTAPFTMSVADPVAGLLPASGEVLVSKTELMVYNTTTCTPGPNQLCITARAKVGNAKDHAVPDPSDPFNGEGRVKLATQLTAPLATGVQTTLSSGITVGQVPPFAITLASGAGFPASGQITVSHQDTDAGGASTEYMAYNSSCGNGPGGSPPQLCVTARALNPNNLNSAHLASGYPQGCSTAGTNWPGPCPQGGVTKITLHQDAAVKASGGLFPSGPLSIYTVDGGNGIVGLENIGYAKGDAAAKLTSPPPASGTSIRIVNRGTGESVFDKTPISAHPANSIVAPPDTYLVCRSRNESPAAFTEPAAQAPKGSSVGVFSACQTRTQPGEPPKTVSPKKLDIPLTGQSLIVLNALSQPFLSTGGFCHLLYGPVDGVPGTPGNCTSETGAQCTNAVDDDADGAINEGCPPWPSPGGIPENPQTQCANNTDDDGDGRVNDGCPNRAGVEGRDLNGTTDGELHLISPCITNFTPGVNLFVQVDIVGLTKNHNDPQVGQIRVVLDAITGPGGGRDGNPATHDDCDDPAGTGDILLNTYFTPEKPSLSTPVDTDGDKCADNKELDNVLNAGGQRDPWNPWDIYDITSPGNPGVGDGAVTADDITLVAANFLQNNNAVDRGSGPPSKAYGPFLHNTAAPDGSVTADDITVVAATFLNSC